MILKLRDDFHQKQKVIRTHNLINFFDQIGFGLNSHIVRENLENKLTGSFLQKGLFDTFQTKLMQTRSVSYDKLMSCLKF
jgi:hypothetical protein